MRDALVEFMADEEIQELQYTTAAFLTDRYEDGPYVATSDDIFELQMATAAFLADRSDGDCFCLDDNRHGLLLPGEQFLLPASAAVSMARSSPYTVEECVESASEYLRAQLDWEMNAHSSLSHNAHGSTDDLQALYTSFNEVLGPNLLPETPDLCGRLAVSLQPEHLDFTLNEELRAEGLGVHITVHNNTSEMKWNTMNDIPDTESDAPAALSRLQASYAASFFDALTGTVVQYTSLDGLLEMEARQEQLRRTRPRQHGRDTADGGDVDTSPCAHAGGEHVCVCPLDSNESMGESFEQVFGVSESDIVTSLPIIFVDTESASAASLLATDSSIHSGLRKPLNTRQIDFSNDNPELAPHSYDPGFVTGPIRDRLPTIEAEHHRQLPWISYGVGAFEAFDGWFADDIWNNELNLELTLPAETVLDTKLELLNALANIYDMIRAEIRAESTLKDIDLKHGLCRLAEQLQDFVSAQRLG